MSRIRVIDFESTGKKPPEHGLCEIGWCDLHSQSTDLVGAPIDWVVDMGSGLLVNPGRNIPALTSAVHNIVDEDVRLRPHWRTELRRFMAETATMDDLIAVAGHSIDAEQSWFDDEIKAPVPWICTYRISLRLWPEAPTHSNAGLRYWRQPSGMNRMLAQPHHRAFPDAYVTAFLLRDLLNSGCSLEQMFTWSKELPLTVRCFIGDRFRRDGEGTPWAEVDSGMLRWILGKEFEPEVMHTARHHLERRAEQAREANERMALNSQLRAAGLPEEPIDPALLAVAEGNQESLF